MSRKRWWKDGIFQGITYGSGMIGIMTLIAIFVFIFSKGYDSLSVSLLKGNYWANNYLTSVQETYNHPGSYQKPADLSDDVVFSSEWGVGFVDHVDQNQDDIVLIEYVDPNSPFANLLDASVKDKTIKRKAESGYQAERIVYQTKNGTTMTTGNIMSANAEETVAALRDADAIEEMYFKTAGGGIRGSIISTFYLILVSICVALPIGVAAAVYLQEYAHQNKLTKWIVSAIDLLSGVPSIIFGLMGVSVLFPITQFFGATTTNILLGGLTMAVILLPTMIRSTQEALYVVPQTYRDASLALGANQSQTLWKVILPNAIPGILTGILLSIGRVIGESAALIYTMGTYINDSPTLLSQGTTLAVHIYNIMSSEQPNFELASAISIVILVFVLALNLFVKAISRIFRKANG